MSNFTINISYPPISYSSKASDISLEACADITRSDAITLLSTTRSTFAMLDAYTGDPKANLILTSISTNDDALTVEYNSSPITNADLPLTIDISALADGDIIPNLTLELDFDIATDDKKKNYAANLSFLVEDENGTRGATSVTSSFQYQMTACTTLSSINSTLPIVSDGNGNVNYQITSTNNPQSYYITGLPTGVTYNVLTGLISGTSNVVATHPITIEITNDAGTSSTATTLEIVNSSPLLAPVITSPLTSTYTYNTGGLTSMYGYKIEATNSPTSFGYTIPQALQPYTTVNEQFLIIEDGNAPAGNYNIGISATNDAGTDSETLILTIEYI